MTYKKIMLLYLGVCVVFGAIGWCVTFYFGAYPLALNELYFAFVVTFIFTNILWFFLKDELQGDIKPKQVYNLKKVPKALRDVLDD